MSFAGPAEIVPPFLPAFAYRPLQVPSARFDPARGDVLVSVVTGATTFALYGLDPTTLQTRWIVPVSSFVSRITLSDDAAFAYLCLPDEGAVQQFDLATRTSVRKFVVADPASGRGPLDIAARPGAPDTVAVSIGFLAAASPYDELSLYDAGVKRPRSMGVVNNGAQVIGDRAPEIEFVDADTLVSFDNETTATTLQRISVVSDGLVPQRSISRIASEGFHADLRFVDGSLYLDFGVQCDPNTLRIVRGFAGVAWNSEHNGCYHPGLRSFVRVAPFFDGNSSEQFRLIFEEYDGTRNVLKRRFRIDQLPVVVNTQIGASPVFLGCEPIGGGRLLVIIYDQGTSQVALLATDVAVIPAYPSPTFEKRTATADGLSVISLSVPAQHMVFDPVGNRLVGATPIWAGALGNSLVVLDASTGALLRTMPMSSPPSRIALAPQIGAAYVSLPAEGVVQQVFLATGALGWRAVLDWPTRQGFNGPPAAPAVGFDLVVKPDDPNTVAVSAGVFEALLMLRDGQIVGTPLDWLSIRTVQPNRIAWRGNNELVAYDMISSDATLSRFSWDGASFALLSQVHPTFALFDTHAKFGFDRLYGINRVCVVPDGALQGEYQAYSDTALASSDVLYALDNDWNTAPGMLRIDERVLDTTITTGERMPRRRSFRILDERFKYHFGNEITSLGGTRWLITQVNDDDRTGYVYIVTAPPM